MSLRGAPPWRGDVAIFSLSILKWVLKGSPGRILLTENMDAARNMLHRSMLPTPMRSTASARNDQQNAMIIFDKVIKTYGKKVKALDDISFEIHQHEFVAFVGKSGAGKSTILKLLIGEEKPTKGRVMLDEVTVSEIREHQKPALRRRIGSVFQDYKLLVNKTVAENVAFAMEAAGRAQKDVDRDVPRVLDLVEMKDKAKRFPHELSGGEKQRAAIARAIVNRPEILIADEPTGNLDIFHAWDIIKLLLKINTLGTTVLLATHDYEVVNALNRRVITLEEGRITRDEEKGKYILSDK